MALAEHMWKALYGDPVEWPTHEQIEARREQLRSSPHVVLPALADAAAAEDQEQSFERIHAFCTSYLDGTLSTLALTNGDVDERADTDGEGAGTDGERTGET